MCWDIYYGAEWSTQRKKCTSFCGIWGQSSLRGFRSGARLGLTMEWVPGGVYNV